MQVIVKGKDTNEQKSSIIIHSTGDNKLEISTGTDITEEYLQIGDVVTYTVTAKNVSSGIIKNVRIAATIPDNLKYLNTTYYLDDKEMFNGYLLENKVTEATLDLDAGQTFTFVVRAAVNKMIDTSKEEEDSNVVIDVTGDDIEDYHDEIKNKIENDNVENSNTYRISGVVWEDSNRNGTRDSDEELLSGIPVTIVDAETGRVVKNSNGDEISATTDENGEYILSDLIQGEYIVKFNYDNSQYVITEYRKQGIDESINSDAINTTENNGVAITDSLTITDTSMSNIDLGLTTKGIFDLSLNKTLTQIQMADGRTTNSVSFDHRKLGKIEENYGLAIYDTGIEFENETLENLGKKPSTTHAEEGGTGMGFMNTFDTINKYKASLIINEIGKESETNYTKAIIIKFDQKNEFKIDSYRQ